MPKKTVKNFESNMEELEDIIAQLESGALSLEESIKQYKKGMDLAVSCNEVLENAKQEVYLYEQGKFKSLNVNEEEES
ncbi:MAG: exodeoxyribonuclease VII small subunit [Cellulosilyticaceae bacterium]